MKITRILAGNSLYMHNCGVKNNRVKVIKILDYSWFSHRNREKDLHKNRVQFAEDKFGLQHGRRDVRGNQE